MRGVRVRFAPSPTGYLHVGGARTALYNWLFARHHKGTFILRIEDTDVERSTEEAAGAIVEGMTWLGLEWDEGPYRQAERLKLYQKYARELVEAGRAYYCYCTPEELEARRKTALAEGRSPKYDGRCRDLRERDKTRPHAIRLRLPQVGRTVVHDLIHGDVVFENAELDDFILLRSDGFPTYNFACVVDDSLMGITHVIRGDDHLSNTPRQVLLYQALGFSPPQFAHLPMILGPDRTRLSKRHGATSVQAYKEIGYLPEALVNYLARLGWSHGDQEVFSREELIQYFSLEKVGKTPAVFDPAKLEWLNGHYLRSAEPARLADLLPSFWEEGGVGRGGELARRDKSWLQGVARLFQERAKTLSELAYSTRFLFAEKIQYEGEAASKFLTMANLSHLEELHTRLKG
ncbi:MAG: glutamate--tRNA ligase, partial [candidate division NC10 bacterium]|nr:glutamate--tRNA ligase [candidate division NC10 bacterium]